MNPMEALIHGAVQYEVGLNTNPFITLETIVLRLMKKICEHTHVLPYENEKTILFKHWHNDILETYYTLRSSMSHDEKSCVERVLSKDSPHTSELLKFACCWYKYNAPLACKLFAVDGLLGSHPKFYVQEAFSNQFRQHNEAVRALYAYFTNPDTVKEIVEKALGLAESESVQLDPDFEKCVALYVEMVGEEEMRLVATERKAKMQQAPKRKKVTPSS